MNLSRYYDRFQGKCGKENVVQKEAKYSLSGNLHAVQYWAYEAISEIGQQFGKISVSEYRVCILGPAPGLLPARTSRIF